MTIITLNPSYMEASNTGQYAYISLKANAYTSNPQSITQSAIFIPLSGSLSEKRWLSYPIIVKIEDDCDEFIVSELKYHIHGVGPTIPAAIEAFKRIFSGYLDILSEEKDNLSAYMYEQLKYLRSAIRIE